MKSEPIVAASPVAPDADWEQVRARLVAHLALHADDVWTDHNAADPGITLAEVLAFGLADAHYRVAEAGFASWPLASRGDLPADERHWHHTVPDPADLTAVATALGAAGAQLEPQIQRAPSRPDAESAVAAQAWAAALTVAQRALVVDLLRGRHVRRMAFEHADLVAAAVASADARGGSLVDRNTAAATELSHSLPLWAGELDALIGRERHRAVLDAMAAGGGEALVAAGASAAQVSLARGLEPMPSGMLPETFEADDGTSLIWPPHGLQALTCEPVTNEDYARRARTHSQVGRAWAVGGRLEGIAWHGLPALKPADIPAGDPRHRWQADPSAAAVTIVVDRVAGASDTNEFLRQVLALAVGTEVRAPFPSWRDDLNPLDPRRVVAHEVGATLLKRIPVTVKIGVFASVSVDHAALHTDLEARISKFFADGRPESRVTYVPDAIPTGPWPPEPQPEGGWIPGESIRFSEVVERITENPDVLGVQELFMQAEGGPEVGASVGVVELPPGSVPILATGDCVLVTYPTEGSCGDA